MRPGRVRRTADGRAAAMYRPAEKRSMYGWSICAPAGQAVCPKNHGFRPGENARIPIVHYIGKSLKKDGKNGKKEWIFLKKADIISISPHLGGVRLFLGILRT